MATGGSSAFGSELTGQALEGLLRRLHPDPEQAGREYIRLRDKLVTYFDMERCETPEDLSDEVLNRVARRLNQGEHIERLGAYSLGVARLVAMEARQRQAAGHRGLREFVRISSGGASIEKESALRCLESCLAKLPAEGRALILGYYSRDRGARIEQRQEMARRLGLNSAALRNRALRLRGNLEACLKRCLRGCALDLRNKL